jgi:hypothetical protein
MKRRLHAIPSLHYGPLELYASLIVQVDTWHLKGLNEAIGTATLNINFQINVKSEGISGKAHC